MGRLGRALGLEALLMQIGLSSGKKKKVCKAAWVIFLFSRNIQASKPRKWPAILLVVKFHTKKGELYRITMIWTMSQYGIIWRLWQIATLDPGNMDLVGPWPLSCRQPPSPLSPSCVLLPSVCSVRLNCQPTGCICASQLQITYLSHRWHYAVNHSHKRTFPGVGFFSQLMIYKHTPKNLTHIYLGKVMGANNTWLNTTPKAVSKQHLF